MIGKAMLRQSEALLNSMESMVARVIKEILVDEYQETGPQIDTFFGETKFYTRAIYKLAINAPENTMAEFVMHAPKLPGDQPMCYDESRAFIPDGFFCQLRYRPLREGEDPPRKPSLGKQPYHTGHIGSGKDKANDDEVTDWQAQFGSGPVFNN